MSAITSAEDAHAIMVDEISWGAVLVGVMVALVTQLILSLSDIGVGVGSTAQTVATSYSRVAVPFSWIQQSVRGATGDNAASLRDAAVTAVWAALKSNPQQAQEARERATQAVARTQNVSVAQARTQVQLYEHQYRKILDQAKQQAIEAAGTGAKAVSRGALFGIIGLLLGAVAGWLGGHMGAVEPILTARVGLDTLQSGPLGGSRTTTVVSAGGAHSTTMSERVMPS